MVDQLIFLKKFFELRPSDGEMILILQDFTSDLNDPPIDLEPDDLTKGIGFITPNADVAEGEEKKDILVHFEQIKQGIYTCRILKETI